MLIFIELILNDLEQPAGSENLHREGSAASEGGQRSSVPLDGEWISSPEANS
jgi:hypothetical protein